MQAYNRFAFVLALVAFTLTSALAFAQAAVPAVEQVKCGATSVPCLVGVPLPGQPWKEATVPSGTDLVLLLPPPPAPAPAPAPLLADAKSWPYWAAIPVGIAAGSAAWLGTYLNGRCPRTQGAVAGVTGIVAAVGSLGISIATTW